jgi:aspartyl aminopeptidase
MRDAMAPLDPALEPARDLCRYLDASPSPFHAVEETTRRLEAAGFTALREVDEWALSPGGKHYVTRADASIVAFRVGARPPVDAGFRLVGAHTDSPNLRLKPQPQSGKEGYQQLGVEIYGGVLLYTWLDRDLSIAGRLVLEESDGTLVRRAARVSGAVCRVASLAIHLDREVNDKGLVLNKQQHMVPILGLGDGVVGVERLFASLAASCGADPAKIRGFDLGLHDATNATLGGHDEAFVFSGRLDNLASCHAAVCALLGAPEHADATRVVALFDHEEIGSESAQGAAGPFLGDVLARIVSATSPGVASGLARALAGSYSISADMAHAVHPNYADKHEGKHMPKLGRGPVVKSNVQQRYATDGLSAARFKGFARDADVAVQDFVTRTDLACGSTIGPITAARLGIATVDVGNPMLSMHSVREMCGSADVAGMIAVMGRAFG